MVAKNIKLLFFVLFLIGLINVLVFRLWQVKRAKSIPFSPQKSSFTSQPPSEALEGELIGASGKVEKEPRGKEEFEKIKLGDKVFQGEKLLTGENSQAVVEFQDFAKISLNSKSEIDFISLLPANFLISQTSGSVSYKLLQDKKPLSVRSLHMLFTLELGESEIMIDKEGGEIIVEQLLGKAKIALVDLENKTHVWELKKGQKALIDDRERTVEIKKL